MARDKHRKAEGRGGKMADGKESESYRAATALFSQALDHHRAGRLDQAQPLYRAALMRDPAHAASRHHLGVIELDRGHPEAAVALIRQSLTHEPDSPEALNNLGIALRHLGHLVEAETALRQALVLRPGYVDALANLGMAMGAAGRLAEAETAYRAALAAKPVFPEVSNNLGIVLRRQGRVDDAIACYRAAIRMRPAYPEAYSNLGYALNECDRPEEAETACRTALALKPAYPEAHNNLIVALHKLGRLDEALRICETALGMAPAYAEFHNNQGNILLELARPAEALAAYDRALALKADYPEARANRAHALLALGDYGRGWAEYEWRSSAREREARLAALPPWRGEPLAGRTILLVGEQGLGDVIQFSRFARDVAALGGEVRLLVPRPLVRLFATLPGGMSVCASDEPQPAADCHIPLMSLPARLGTTLATVPAPIPYLSADSAEAARWRERLAHLSGARVGLVWAGNPRAHNRRANAIDRRRSLPLARLEPLLRLPGVSFISLQKDDAARQLESLPDNLRPFDPMGDVADFADTAAIVANLDLVISVDTAVAHLAGAMGKPVWVLSRFDACWRWLLDRDDSPWYPSLRLFRQQRPGDWDEVATRARDALAGLFPIPPAMGMPTA